eukprot:TRINITY_DN943_c0_g3_i1.p1 TRINITY_DN943_c0_g3~~TRINITY_DN943_c0_g3_i1.p1  ORF type:complete len:382 (-),score=89.51 TRINITY_DN943_c0_g3_i1:23-1114(-)
MDLRKVFLVVFTLANTLYFFNFFLQRYQNNFAQSETSKQELKLLEEQIKKKEGVFEELISSLEVKVGRAIGEENIANALNRTKEDQTLINSKKSLGYLIKRKKFPLDPSIRPDLCLAFLSSRRYELLQQSMISIISYLEENEPELNYEVVVFENAARATSSDECATNEFQTKILDRFQIDRYGKSYWNFGIAFGLNNLFFGLCRAPFILSLEDDWTWGKREYDSEKALTSGISVLKSDSNLISLYYRWVDQDDSNHEEKLHTNAQGERIPYRWLMGKPSGQNFRAHWAYANGGTLLKREALNKVGFLSEEPEANFQYEYAERAVKNNFYGGYLQDESLGGEISIRPLEPVSYTHLTLPTICSV